MKDINTSHSDSDTTDTSRDTGTDTTTTIGGARLDRRTALKALGAAGLVSTVGATTASAATTRVGELDRTTTPETSRREWHGVSFADTITDPVVVMGPLSYDGAHPAHPRLRNLGDGGFEWRLEEWSYLGIGGHAAETTSYLAVERGVHEIDGLTVEAGTVEADHFWQDAEFAAGFEDAPLLFTTPQTTSGGDPIVSRTKDVTSDGFTIQAREEQSGLGHATERMGYVAVEDAVSARFDVGTELTDHEWATVADPVDDRTAFVASVATNNGGDPCNPRYRRTGDDTVAVRVQEERSVDPEVYHATERVVRLSGDPGALNATTGGDGDGGGGDGGGDTTPPNTPSLSEVSHTDSSVTVDPSVVNDSEFYTIYVDGDHRATTDGNPVTVGGLESDTEYSFTATATDEAGNESDASESLPVTTTDSEGGGGGGGEPAEFRVGYSADGNIRDPDDLHASPMTLLTLAESGMSDQLVHFDYSNIIGVENDEDQTAEHIDHIYGAIDRLGLDESVFYDDHGELDASLDSMTEAINESGPDDRFVLLVAGRMEVPYRAITAADEDKQQYCTVVSHSAANDNYTNPPEMTHTWDDIGDDTDVERVHIANQNDHAFKSPPRDWEWLEELQNGEWWYDVVVNPHPRGDASDAGMTWWLVRGRDDDTPDMGDVREFFQPYDEAGG